MMTQRQPQHQVTLPIPEGFSQLAPPDKLGAMRELREDPATDPYVLQGVAWDVLSAGFYGGALPDPELLPEARNALQTIVDRKEDLPPDDPNLYLDTRLAMIGYGVFRSVIEQKPLTIKSRAAMVSLSGKLIHEVAAPVDFNLDDLDVRVNRKMIETMLIGTMAYRDRRPYATPIPAIPTVHNMRGIDPGTNTSDFSMYLLQDQHAVPTSVNKFTDEHMYDRERHHGVLQVPLGPLLWNTSHSIESIVEVRKTKGKVSDGQRWLMGQTARHLAGWGENKVEIPGDYATLMDLAARYVSMRAQKYDPTGLNAPVNDRAKRGG